MRAAIVSAVALLVVWQSNCLTWSNGVLVNRCGLWQRFTGQPITLAFKMSEPATVVIERERVIERTIERIIERQAAPPLPQTAAPPVVIYRDRSPFGASSSVTLSYPSPRMFTATALTIQDGQYRNCIACVGD